MTTSTTSGVTNGNTGTSTNAQSQQTAKWMSDLNKEDIDLLNSRFDFQY